MKHTLTFDREAGDDVVFRCQRCSQEIGFNQPGVGTPAAIQNKGAWEHPADPDQWMTPCESPEQPLRDALAAELEAGTKTSLTTEDALLIARALKGL